jgi:hypothetical protein
MYSIHLSRVKSREDLIGKELTPEVRALLVHKVYENRLARPAQASVGLRVVLILYEDVGFASLREG